MGTADASTVSSPVMASDKEHWVDILPVMRNPPMGHYFLSVMRQSTNIYLYSKQKMVKKIRKLNGMRLDLQTRSSYIQEKQQTFRNLM